MSTGEVISESYRFDTPWITLDITIDTAGVVFNRSASLPCLTALANDPAPIPSTKLHRREALVASFVPCPVKLALTRRGRGKKRPEWPFSACSIRSNQRQTILVFCLKAASEFSQVIEREKRQGKKKSDVNDRSPSLLYVSTKGRAILVFSLFEACFRASSKWRHTCQSLPSTSPGPCVPVLSGQAR